MTEQKKEPEQLSDMQSEFDINRKARQAMLDDISGILNRSASGSKINDKEVKQSIALLRQYDVMVDDLVTGLLNDLFKIVQAVASSEVNIFALRTNLKTVVRALEKQGIINQKMMQEIHDKEILPNELKAMAGNQDNEQILRSQDIVAVDKQTSHDE